MKQPTRLTPNMVGIKIKENPMATAMKERHIKKNKVTKADKNHNNALYKEILNI